MRPVFVNRIHAPIVQRSFRRSLSVWLDALGQRREQLQRNERGAKEGLVRVARALGNTAASYALDDLASASRAVVSAEEGILAKRLDELLDVLRRAMHPSDRSRRTVLVVSADLGATNAIVATSRPYAHRVETVQSTAAARTFIVRHVPGLIFLDASLPDEPLQWLVELRSAPVAFDIPVVVIAPGGILRNEALALGASEFVRKPADAATLQASLGAHLGHEGRTMLELAGDPITGLSGPALFQEAASDQSIRNHGRKWAVVVLGWHNRKELEAADPKAPDDVARQLSDALRAHFPEPILIARLDQDTFALLMPDAIQERVNQRLREFLQRLIRRTVGHGHPIHLCAGGVVCLDASYPKVLATARRMQHLATIAGDAVLMTTLESSPHQRLLLVDEDPEVAEALRGVLRKGRCDVVYRRNVLEGLEAAAEKDFDLVMVNAAMPNQGGFDLLSTLRGWPHYTARPIVLLTGEDRERVRAYELGADDCIGKPFNPEVVRARVRSLLSRETR